MTGLSCRARRLGALVSGDDRMARELPAPAPDAHLLAGPPLDRDRHDGLTPARKCFT